jgi:hypothetical protein
MYAGIFFVKTWSKMFFIANSNSNVFKNFFLMRNYNSVYFGLIIQTTSSIQSKIVNLDF